MRRLRAMRNVPTTVCAAGVSLIAALASRGLDAQELRGTVMMADGVTPASGVVAVMMHATRTDSIVARAVTNERGRFLLRPPASVAAQLRFLRIGYEPTVIGTFRLGTGETRDSTFTMQENRVRLATFDVKAASRCEVQPSGGQLVSQLYQQARTALIASTTPLRGTVVAQFTNFNRMQDRRRRLLVPVERTTQTGESLKPYSSIAADSLDRVGYMFEQGENSIYYGPDAEVLLSDRFLAQHCVQLVAGKDSLSTLIGIGFKPVARRGKLIDVEGTLWLDRATSELQFLEFNYTSLPEHLRTAGLGGRVDYAQLSNGSWIVHNWSIRMPILSLEADALPTAGNIGKTRLVASGLQVTGGAVQNIRVDNQVLYLNPGAASVGTEPGDSPGSRNFTVRPSTGSISSGLDQLDKSVLPASCAVRKDDEYLGSIAGLVYDEQKKGFAGASVRAEWKDDFRGSIQGGFIWTNRTLNTNTIADGVFLLCGMPLRRPVQISARRTALWTKPTTVRLDETEPTADLDLMLEGGDSATATSRQSPSPRVAPEASTEPTPSNKLLLTTSAGLPIPYVLVAMNNGAPLLTDSLGAVTVPARFGDSMLLSVRRIGYQPYDGRVIRAATAEKFSLSLLPGNQLGNAFNVGALARTGFYARMLELQGGAGAGEFATPEQVAARQNSPFSAMFSNSRTLKVDNAKGKTVLRGRDGCEMIIVIDGVRRSLDDRSIDDIVSIRDVMAIEVYASIAASPPAVKTFAGTGSCGVVAVWTGAR